MSRYDITKITQTRDGKRKKYSTTIYDEVPKLNTDMYFITQDGDRLDSLAFEFYGDQHLWWFIARANNLKTMNVSAGTRIRIPVSAKNAKGR